MSVEIESLGPINRGWVPKVETTKEQYAAIKEQTEFCPRCQQYLPRREFRNKKKNATKLLDVCSGCRS